MNAENYRQVIIHQVLIHHVIPSGRCPIGNNFIFQHENDSKHTANAVKSYLATKIAVKTLAVMDWPPQSSGLNIIEEVWDHLDRE
ncbi:hypothetical protein JRQ81_007372, partial [Phrynocephalus forsythii]